MYKVELRAWLEKNSIDMVTREPSGENAGISKSEGITNR